jgi:hypothetical protein
MRNFLILAWLSCGYVGWFMSIRTISAYRRPSAYDASMIVPGVFAGPVFLIMSAGLANKYS